MPKKFPEFESPSQVYQFVDYVIDSLEEKEFNAAALRSVQKTAYTTSSEWLGALGSAVKAVQKQKIRDKQLRSDLRRILRFVNSGRPGASL